MVGVSYLQTDLWNLRSSAQTLRWHVRSTIDNLGLQRRRRPRGNRAGQLVRQRQQVYVRPTVVKCETESETVASSKPILAVRSSSRRRAHRSILPPRHQLTRVVAATTSPPVTPPHDARSPAASAHRRPALRHGVLHCRLTASHRR